VFRPAAAYSYLTGGAALCRYDRIGVLGFGFKNCGGSMPFVNLGANRDVPYIADDNHVELGYIFLENCSCSGGQLNIQFNAARVHHIRASNTSMGPVVTIYSATVEFDHMVASHSGL
jgi:hypothetical protein